MKQPKTEQQAFQQLAALCARGEHCLWDMQEKMRRWELSDDARQRIAGQLTAGRYVDDRRYAAAFAADKARYDKWGRRKIEQALRMKHIDEDTVSSVMDDLGDDIYTATLQQLLRQKQKTVKASSDYELRQKLVRFAMGRGFTYDIIRQCIDTGTDADELEDY